MGKFVNGEICAKVQRLIENEGLDHKQVAFCLKYHPYTIKRIMTAGYDYVTYRANEVRVHKNTYATPKAIERLKRQGIPVEEPKPMTAFQKFLAFFND